MTKKEINKRYREKHKEKIATYNKKYNEKHKKEIKKHFESNLEKTKVYKKKWYDKNSEIIKEKAKKRYEVNSEVIKEYQKINSEKINIYKKKYRKAHKEEIKERNKIYTKEKRKTDPAFKILCNLRVRIHQSIKGINKSFHTMDLAGCSIQELLTHLQNQFTEGMSFENYGSWHIDHIRPCSSFNLINEAEQKECFNYKNLQPLWAADNLKKSNKWDNTTEC